MSVTANPPRGMNLPKPKPPVVPVTQENVRDWWALFVNRKAYTRQSTNPHPDTGRHCHYQAKNKDGGQPLELDPATVRKHLAGWITIGLYAINSQSQRCKWIAIDADYEHAFFDLGKLKGELELDGVSAALEMSRRGGAPLDLLRATAPGGTMPGLHLQRRPASRGTHQGSGRPAGRHRALSPAGQARPW